VIIRSYKLYYNSDKSSAKSKHIDIKFLVIKDKVQNHIVSSIVLIVFLTLQIHSLKTIDCLKITEDKLSNAEPILQTQG